MGIEATVGVCHLSFLSLLDPSLFFLLKPLACQFTMREVRLPDALEHETEWMFLPLGAPTLQGTHPLIPRTHP